MLKEATCPADAAQLRGHPNRSSSSRSSSSNPNSYGPGASASISAIVIRAKCSVRESFPGSE